MRNLVATNQFKKDLKLAVKRQMDINLLNQVISMLQTDTSLPEQYKDHALTGEFSGCRECHLKPNWLLIYKISGDNLLLYLMRTGTHADLFKK